MYKYNVSFSPRASYIGYVVFASPGEKHAGGCFDLVIYKYIDSFTLTAFYSLLCVLNLYIFIHLLFIYSLFILLYIYLYV